MLTAGKAAELMAKWAVDEEDYYAEALAQEHTFRAQQAKDTASACRNVSALLMLLEPNTTAPDLEKREAYEQGALRAAIERRAPA